MRAGRVLFVVALLLAAAPATTDAKFLDKIKCTSCKALGGLAVGLVRLTGSSSLMRSKAKMFCKLIPVARSVCVGYIDSWGEALTYIVQNSRLSASEMCALYLDSCERRQIQLDVTLDLPDPPGRRSVARRNDNYPPPSTRGLKVLHIADIHLDFRYAEGADNSCPEVLCCRADNGFPANRSRRAGRWGDYTRCDAPFRLVHAMVKQAARQYQGNLAYIMWTGDNAPHDNWRTSREEVLDASSNITQLLARYFPGVPVYPVIGNHDSAPINSFSPPEVWRDGFSAAWLYSTLADLWKPWLTADAVATMGRAGYYSVPVRPGFRIIVLNTNVAYKLNFWVLLTAHRDPYNQLRWLAEELQASQMAREKVHLIGHISPADPDILPAWSHMYHRILHRYQNTVTAQFFSHTHVDEVQLSKDDRDKAFSVSYVAPSLSPWKNVNPGYKIYTIDGARRSDSTWEVIDMSRWTADLVDANRRPRSEPVWTKQYTASKEYGLKNLSPVQWSRTINAMLLTDQLFSKYYRNLSGRSRAQKACDGECRQRVICNVVTSDRSSQLHCQLARAAYRAGVAMGRTGPRHAVPGR